MTASTGDLAQSRDVLRADPALQTHGLTVTDVLGEGGSAIVYPGARRATRA